MPIHSPLSPGSLPGPACDPEGQPARGYENELGSVNTASAHRATWHSSLTHIYFANSSCVPFLYCFFFLCKVLQVSLNEC